MNMSELKTSEGRAHLLGQAILAYSAIHGYLPPAMVAKISVIAFAVYSAARAIVKAVEAISPSFAAKIEAKAAIQEVKADIEKVVSVLPQPPAPKP